MGSGVGFFVLAIVVVVAFFVVMTPLVVLANRAIGAHYDQKAWAIAPYLDAERVVFAEDGARMRLSAVAVLAVGVQWRTVNVRVTTRAIYLFQSSTAFGARLGQPILAFPLRGADLDPFVAASVVRGWLGTAPAEEGGFVVFSGGIPAQRVSIRLGLRDPRAFVAATS
jgi:hypothetical protein